MLRQLMNMIQAVAPHIVPTVEPPISEAVVIPAVLEEYRKYVRMANPEVAGNCK